MRALAGSVRLTPLFALVAAASSVGCSSASPPAHAPSQVAMPTLPARPAFDEGAIERERQATDARATFGPNDSTKRTTTDALASEQVTASGSRPNVLARAAGALTPGSAKQAGYSFSSDSIGSTGNLPAAAERGKHERVEIEAQFAVEVDDVSASADKVRELSASFEGTISKDERHSPARPSPGVASRAELLVRVPSERFEAFSGALGKIGTIRSRNVRASDVSLEEKDLGILLDNLTAALTRYRELLHKATSPADILAIERELERVASAVDRVKGRLEWLRDRIARATVAIALQSPQPDHDVEEDRQAYFSPGARGIFHFDGGENGSDAYVGAGLSFRFPQAPPAPWRGLVLDVDIFKACCGSTPDRGDTAFSATTGLDLYSAALGGGRRRWLNPYLGLRVGYAETRKKGDFAAAGVLGLEVLKTKVLLIDLQMRLIAMLGNPDGPHGALQPSLGLGLQF
jgi:uncharacterized protein DUF4349